MKKGLRSVMGAERNRRHSKYRIKNIGKVEPKRCRPAKIRTIRRPGGSAKDHHAFGDRTGISRLEG